MTPNPKVVAAFSAMANLGIHESQVKPVLKKLLKLYDKNWELIEEENYRALADAIFEEEENKLLNPDQNNKSEKIQDGGVDDGEAHMQKEPLRPLKRLRLRGQEGQSSRSLTSGAPSSAAFPLKTPKLEDGTVPENNSRVQPQRTTALSDGNARNDASHVLPQDAIVNRGKQPVSPQVSPRGGRPMSDRTPLAEPLKVSAVEPRPDPMANNKMSHPVTLIKPKDEPVDDLPDFEIPFAVFPSEPSTGGDSLMGAAEKQDGHDTMVSISRDEDIERGYFLPSSVEEVISNVDVALSSMGEEQSVKITQTDDVLKESETNGSPIVRGNKDSAEPQVPSFLPSPSDQDDVVLASKKVGTTSFLQSDGGKEPEDPVSPNSGTLVVVPKGQLTTEYDERAVHDVNDLTKGEERVNISWVNNTTNDLLPPFHYISRNLVFRDAYVNITLSRIGKEDCCSTCKGNCVLSSKPCPCTKKTRDEFAFTAQGLLKEAFLEECIAISRDPQNYFYCKTCPFERSKNDDCLEPCKGHIKRKFIKECWSNCGCAKYCGNRVVQRGISCKLQVFLTSDGKGWGLRTLEDLPKGAFVCEFVGEILTVEELHERNMKYPKNGKYTYPVLLDADWGLGVVKDREALCLYAASYGNAARFINHRCLDANLIEIPVEIESPTHHYYHFAFFASRKIAAQEELTWDYGINFDDHDESVERFQCRCGSKFCRNIKRSSRSIRS